MKFSKDKRVTVRFISLKQFLAIFALVLFICGDYHVIYLSYIESNNNANPLFGVALVLAISLIGAILLSIVKTVYFDKPLRTLAEAAKKVSGGDFSIRVPQRNDGKKDYIEVLIEDFNTMTTELATIETLKTDFITNVSHEIKTPLSVIQSYAAAIQDDALTTGERQEYGKTIVEASKKLTELVTNILKLNKLENQEILPISHAYSLDEQLRECVLNYEELWDKKNITLDGENINEVEINCDRALLELVWNNLISNAIKFTGIGGTIALSLKAENGAAIVTISDSGCGMSAETVAHIFDRFYQGDTSHSAEGNGLGLSLVKKVIALVGGEISVASEIGEGTTFTVKLLRN
jgi:signal transduction histidine kinase